MVPGVSRGHQLQACGLGVGSMCTVMGAEQTAGSAAAVARVGAALAGPSTAEFR